MAYLVCFLLSIFHKSALNGTVSAHLHFAIPVIRYSVKHTLDYTITLLIPLSIPISRLHLLWLLLTSHCSLLLQLMKPSSFSSFTCLIYIYGLRLPFGLRYLSPAYPPYMPYIRFLFIKLWFRYLFFLLAPHSIKLKSPQEVCRKTIPLVNFCHKLTV